MQKLGLSPNARYHTSDPNSIYLEKPSYVAIADVLDALTNDKRTYREPISYNQALLQMVGIISDDRPFKKGDFDI